MAIDFKAVNWAREEARKLREELDDPDIVSFSHGRLASAATFFKVQCSASSYYPVLLDSVLRKGMVNYSDYVEVADALASWADYASSGLPMDQPHDLRVRLEASTDLMEQVEVLLDDPSIAPAAPVMLAGAALEELLRGMVMADGVSVTGKPGIDAYAGALRSADKITKQEKKLIDAWGGHRNDAAHGHFDRISRDDASVMAQGVNLLIGKYS